MVYNNDKNFSTIINVGKIKLNQLETSALGRWMGFTGDMYEGMTECNKTRTMRKISTRHGKKKKKKSKFLNTALILIQYYPMMYI